MPTQDEIPRFLFIDLGGLDFAGNIRSPIAFVRWAASAWAIDCLADLAFAFAWEITSSRFIWGQPSGPFPLDLKIKRQKLISVSRVEDGQQDGVEPSDDTYETTFRR